MAEPYRPSGRQVELVAGPYAATVTEVGAALRTMTHGGNPLILGFGEDDMASGGRGQVLLPWPNRIEDGRYHFAGSTHQLPLSEPARHNASHGLVRWLPWRLRQTGQASVSTDVVLHAQPGYPFTLSVVVSYGLGHDGLRVRTRATNLGATPAPYGHGMHPYLLAGSGDVDGWQLTVPADQVCDVDERGLPGPPRPVEGSAEDFRQPRVMGATRLDHPFTGLRRDDVGRATVAVRGPGSADVELWMDRSYRWVQVFTADTLSGHRRAGLAVEPMTCPPNAFRSGTDLVLLEPGGSHEAAWGIRAG